jgi:hypothetical protein
MSQASFLQVERRIRDLLTDMGEAYGDGLVNLGDRRVSVAHLPCPKTNAGDFTPCQW